MKRVVRGSTLAQPAMRPADLVDEYLRLVEEDIVRFGLRRTGLPRACPACGGVGAHAFGRLGFPYWQCCACRTLFVGALPDARALLIAQAEGAAERFWRDRVLPATAEARAKHGPGARARWVSASAAARLGGGLVIVDVGGRDPLVAGALGGSAVCAHYSVESLAEPPAAPPCDVIVAFEALERFPDFDAGLGRCRDRLREGGLLFVSSISGAGFELRMLRERMRSLVPPIHLHLLTRTGWEVALARAGFDILEYSTPGELDVQAVALELGDPLVELPPVVDDLVRHADESVRRGFQELLQQAGLSNHLQFVARAGTRAASPKVRGNRS